MPKTRLLFIPLILLLAASPASFVWVAGASQSSAPGPTFLDVTAEHPYFHEIEWLYEAGMTAGCSEAPRKFCPDRPLDREEAAVFLLRGLHGAEVTPPQPESQLFEDVPLSRWSVEWVSELWEEGLTDGCGEEPPRFCPDRGHTRAEVSVFALRIQEGVDFLPPEPSGAFDDVPQDHWAAEWVESAYHAGLLPPCETHPALRFCPEAPVTRGEMAAILVRALDLGPGERPPLPQGVQVVPTFESLGLYWETPQGGEGVACRVAYRALGASGWEEGFPLWFDPRDGQYRGSLVELSPGTRYEVRLTLEGTGVSESFQAQTWRAGFPVAQTVFLPEHSAEPLVIKKAGSPEGYILYTPAPGREAVIDVGYRHDRDIEISGDAAYVILRGLTLRGAREHGIAFTGPAHDIVIEGNDISGWGTNGPEGWGSGYQSAVYAPERAKVERIILQRNRMHHPRSDTNSWEEYREDKDTYHPIGPQAVTFFNSKGNHVIRYNAIYSDFDHYFNDPIGGGSNFSFEGFPHRDSDIYGNYIAHAWDDGIESEGANMNVRIWGNYIEHTFVKIAIASTSRGPLYIWRNVAGASRRSPIEPDPDAYGRSHFLKAGGLRRDGTWYGSGRTYLFHNTVLQPEPPDGATYPLGGAGGIIGSGGDLYELTSRNNLFTHYKGGTTFRDNVDSCTNDWDYDLYHGRIKDDCDTRPHESHGHAFDGEGWWRYLDPAQPPFLFDPLTGTAYGSFALDPEHEAGAWGIDGGLRLPGFNGGYLGAAPDVGAFEAGAPPMEFGVGAYLGD